MKCPHTNCQMWEEGRDDEECRCVDGRWMEAVSEHSYTCDSCGELTHHTELAMDPETHLGYCVKCVEEAGLPRKHDLDSPWA